MKITIFDTLLSTPMTRKEFLMHLGLLVLAISGISALLHTLTDPNLGRTRTTRRTRLSNSISAQVSRGFGTGPYGG